MKFTTTLFLHLFFLNFLNGQIFHQLCSGSTTNGTVVDFEYYNDTLYATGFFNTICGESADYVAKWDNENDWQPSSLGIAHPGHALSNINDELFIAQYIESIDSNWVYKYSNSLIEKVGQGVYLTSATSFSQLAHIYDIIEYNGQLIACGEFDRVGQDTIRGIMRWNGVSWEGLGEGLSGNIDNTAPVIYPHKMLVVDTSLYVVGNFKYAGNIEVNGIAKWNGTQWSALGNGFNNTVYGIAHHDGQLIAGGAFTESNGATMNRIASWDGFQWNALEFGFTSTSMNDFIYVHTLSVFNNTLYIAGGLKQITFADSSTQNCDGIISYFNNTTWTLGGGVPNNDIEAIMYTPDSELLIGGGVYGKGYLGKLYYEIGIEEEKSLEINVFPNPLKNSISINSNIQFDTYSIYDLNGKLIQSGQFTSLIPVNFNSGIYVLKLFGEKQISTVRLVKT